MENNKKIKIYIASGWFNERDEKILSELEVITDGLRNAVDTYSPRRDGVKLKSDEFHSQNLREKVFSANVDNIDSADLIIANLDTGSKSLDTGTIWEVAHAMAKGIPVVAVDFKGYLDKKIFSIVDGLDALFDSYVSLSNYLIDLLQSKDLKITETPAVKSPRILLIGPDTTDELRETNLSLYNILLDTIGNKVRWVSDLSHDNLFSRVDDMFTDVDLVVAVIDDRNPVVSWTMGQAYARDIPIISYTNYDYGVNLMLALSILYHVKGLDSFKSVMTEIKFEGLSSLKGFNTESLKVY